MQANRRRFLQVTAAATLGLADFSAFRALAAAEEPQKPLEGVHFGPDIDAIVRIIEETPREKCVPALVEQLRGGMPYRRFLSALFLAAIRRPESGHQVYLVHSANQASLDLPSEERLLPLFWAVDHYKWVQEGGLPAAMQPLDGALPAAENAPAEFHDAMKRSDADKAERAVVALAQSDGARLALEQLWPYGCRDISFIGHRAIAVSSCYRALEVIGWQQAEAVLRFVVQDLFRRGGGQDRYYEANIARADDLIKKLPVGWAVGKADRAATLELFALLRQGKSSEACELAAKQLAGGPGAQAVWDAVHIAAAELMIVHPGGSNMTVRPVHVNTSANALHFAFATSTTERSRLIALLQAVAWVADFIRVDLGDKNLKDTEPVALDGAKLPPSVEEAVAEIFAQLPPLTFSYDHKTKKGPGLEMVKREDRAEPGRKVFAFVTKYPEAAPLYMRAGYSWLCAKAAIEAHQYKLPVALFEDYDKVSPTWRPRLLAATAHWLHGKQTPDSPVIVQAREALQKKG